MSIASITQTQVADHKRRSKPTNLSGGISSSASWSTITPSIPGSLQPLSQIKIQLLGVRSINATHSFFSAVNVAYENGDVLVINALTYEIVSVRDEAGRGKVFNYYCNKIDS